jgi:hypothetical protein
MQVDRVNRRERTTCNFGQGQFTRIASCGYIWRRLPLKDFIEPPEGRQYDQLLH